MSSAILLCAASSAHAQVLNGGFEDRTPLPASEGDCFTGEARGRFAPDPWVRINTPDYNTEREIGFTVNYVERVNLPGFNISPSGGCFQSMRNREGLTQDIVIADASEPLKWTYDYTEYTRPGRAQCTPNIEFRVNSTSRTTGTVVGAAPNRGTVGGPPSEGSWVVTETPPFTPSSFGVADGGTLSIYFGSNSSCVDTWGFLDGIAIVTATPPLPGLTLTKTADDDTNRAVGDVITYTYTVENTGNVDIDDVTVSDVHNGSGALSAITINALTNTSGNSSDDGADGDIDVLAPGDIASFEATYEVTISDAMADENITNVATATGAPAAGTLTDPTANESVSVAAPASLPLLPQLALATCGTAIAEAYLLDGLGIGGEKNYFLDSGSPTHDPDVFFGAFGAEHAYTKNADGSVDYFFDGEAPVSTVSGQGNINLNNLITIPGGAADQTDAGEFWRFAARLHGTAGQTENFTISQSNAHEFIHWWAEDSAGTVIGTSLGASNTANGWHYGSNGVTTSAGDATFPATPITGSNQTPISYTLPASNTDGIVILRAVLLDPQAGHGGITLNGQPDCPVVTLDAEKTVSMFGTSGAASYAIPGNDVIYSISVSNSGTGPADEDSIEIIDIMPPEISFWNGDIDTGGPDNFTDTTPVAIVQTAGTGLTFAYSTDVRFGFGTTAPSDFDSCTPLAPDGTYRDDVRFICFNPKGALNGGTPAPSFSLNFRARIN